MVGGTEWEGEEEGKKLNPDLMLRAEPYLGLDPMTQRS